MRTLWNTVGLEDFAKNHTVRECAEHFSCSSIAYKQAEKGVKGSKHYHYKHGSSNTRLYNIWSGMKRRCQDPKHKDYPRYGARGIKICDEWMTFEKFHNWAMSNGYADGLEIDRIDNEKGYCPENCRWVSRAFNRKHQRKTRYLEIFGVRLNISEWCKEVKMSKSTAYKYLSKSDETFIKEIEKRIRTGKGQVYFVNKFISEVAV